MACLQQQDKVTATDSVTSLHVHACSKSSCGMVSPYLVSKTEQSSFRPNLCQPLRHLTLANTRMAKANGAMGQKSQAWFCIIVALTCRRSTIMIAPLPLCVVLWVQTCQQLIALPHAYCDQSHSSCRGAEVCGICLHKCLVSPATQKGSDLYSAQFRQAEVCSFANQLQLWGECCFGTPTSHVLPVVMVHSYPTLTTFVRMYTGHHM